MTKSKKVILIIIGIILVLALPIVGVFGYYFYSGLTCGSFNNNPLAAVEGCSALTKIFNQNKNPHDLGMETWIVLWLHLAHLNVGQDDHLEFQENSARYLSDKWPAPLLKLYLGKVSVDEVYAASKLPTENTDNNPACEASFYIGGWYTNKHRKEEARTALETAKIICPADTIEQANLSHYSLFKILITMIGT